MPPLRLRRRKLSPLCRGNLQDSAGPSVGDDATCGDFAADCKERKSLVEEVDVEGKAHAECVHARTTGNEKARANLIALEMRKPGQASTEAGRNRNLSVKHRANRKATQARCEKTVSHEIYKPPRRRILPTSNR